ncbi:helicase DnaB [Vulcanococcus sp.]|uniref:helicase DnaB n=1 Tax=Vulcanococcus sp. TaxID=2856995 RepID=UPI0037D99717
MSLPRGMKRVLTAGLLLGLGFSEWNSASLAPLRGLLPAADQLDPTTFSPEEIRALQRRFGVHGPQPRLAQLFTHGVDQLTPVRNNALTQLQTLQPVIQQVSRRSGINPMLLAAILFDEIQHAKPGESLPIAAHSGLFSTLGPAQLGVSEMVKQGLLPDNPTAEQVADAREQLLDPERNVALLAGKLSRLLQLLELEPSATDNVSGQRSHAKAVATLAYLHNGKLDYPARILRYMQDPELHGLVFGQRKKPVSALI